MSGHQYPRISGRDKSSVHAGDRYNSITSNGLIFMFNRSAQSLREELRKQTTKDKTTTQENLASLILEDVIRRFEELGTKRRGVGNASSKTRKPRKQTRSYRKRESTSSSNYEPQTPPSERVSDPNLICYDTKPLPKPVIGGIVVQGSDTDDALSPEVLNKFGADDTVPNGDYRKISQLIEDYQKEHAKSQDLLAALQKITHDQKQALQGLQQQLTHVQRMLKEQCIRTEHLEDELRAERARTEAQARIIQGLGFETRTAIADCNSEIEGLCTEVDGLNERLHDTAKSIVERLKVQGKEDPHGNRNCSRPLLNILVVQWPRPPANAGNFGNFEYTCQKS